MSINKRLSRLEQRREATARASNYTDEQIQHSYACLLAALPGIVANAGDRQADPGADVRGLVAWFGAHNER